MLSALYLHIPFCLQRCAYCDFYTFAVSSPEFIDRYVTRLTEELERLAPQAAGGTIQTVFLGGGTPSLLTAAQLAAILAAINRHYHLDPQAEITLEANPATLPLAKLQSFAASGVNRISLGVQSFCREELTVLGRVHDLNQIFLTLEDVNRAGISNYSLDLIYGVPGQSLASWHYSLEKALQTGASHLSLYLLQLEEHTPLGRAVRARTLELPEEDREVEMYYSALNYLAAHGFPQYELSNFAVPGRECRHNLTYWRAEPYLGVGSGAVSFLGRRRLMFHETVEAFLQGDGAEKILETMDAAELVSDALILGLRLRSGVDLNAFKTRFGVEVGRRYAEEIARLGEAGLLELEAGHLRLTRRGLFLSNQVFQCLL
jgi:oxygen-independent coproporphyrinogen-3 oxidase